MSKQFVGTLHIVDMHWQKGKPPAIYQIHCTCNNDLFCDANYRGMLDCPVCGARESFRLLWKAWRGIPHRKMLGRYTTTLDNLAEKLLVLMGYEKDPVKRKKWGVLLYEICLSTKMN